MGPRIYIALTPEWSTRSWISCKHYKVLDMSFFRSLYLSILLSASIALADGTFKSRPDLSPPRLNITVSIDESVAAGYIFVAPYNFEGHVKNKGPLQAAPYIFTSSGDLVWSGYTYFSEWAGNFQVVQWKGENYLAAAESSSPSLHGHGHGQFTLLDQRYQHVKRLQAGHHELADIHEFSVVDEKSALLEIYHPLQRDLGHFGGDRGQTWIIDPRVQGKFYDQNGLPPPDIHRNRHLNRQCPV